MEPSTCCSYSSGQHCFFQFCTSVGLLRQSGSPFPASKSTLELFVSHLSSVLYCTVKCHLAAVRSLQIDLGFDDPLTATSCLKHVLQGIKHSKGSMVQARFSRLHVTHDLMLIIHTYLNLANLNSALLWQPSRQPGLAFCTSANLPPYHLALIPLFTYPSVTWRWTDTFGPLACFYLSRLPRPTPSARVSSCFFLELVAHFVQLPVFRLTCITAAIRLFCCSSFQMGNPSLASRLQTALAPSSRRLLSKATCQATVSRSVPSPSRRPQAFPTH